MNLSCSEQRVNEDPTRSRLLWVTDVHVFKEKYSSLKPSLLVSTATNPLWTTSTLSLRATSRRSWRSSARCSTTTTPGSTSASISSPRQDIPSSPWTWWRWRSSTVRYAALTLYWSGVHFTPEDTWFLSPTLPWVGVLSFPVERSERMLQYHSRLPFQHIGFPETVTRYFALGYINGPVWGETCQTY